MPTRPVAIPVDGARSARNWPAVDAKWQITFLVDGQRKTMPAADLVRWGQCPEQGRAGGLVLADGSFLVADVAAADKDRLSADSDLFGTQKIPLEALSGVILHPPSSQPDRDKLFDRLVHSDSPHPNPLPKGEGTISNSPLPLGEGQGVRAARSDRLLLDNGDELAGLFEGIANDVVTLRGDAGPVEVKTDRIAAILFNPALKRRPAKTGPVQAWAGFSDGSRLLATELLVEGKSLKLTAAGQTFAAAARDLVFLQPLSGRVTYLSDLKPAEYRQTPYLDLAWPYEPDRSVTGGLLRSGGRLFLKGLGVHSAARLAYSISPLPLGEGPGMRAAGGSSNNVTGVASPHPNPLPEGEGTKVVSPLLPPGEGPGVRAAGARTRRFEALVGIDDSTAGGGSVIFRVLVDGQERFTSRTIRGGEQPVPVSVDLAGAKKLELIVDYADRADVLDHADWLDARIVESGE